MANMSQAALKRLVETTARAMETRLAHPRAEGARFRAAGGAVRGSPGAGATSSHALRADDKSLPNGSVSAVSSARWALQHQLIARAAATVPPPRPEVLGGGGGTSSSPPSPAASRPVTPGVFRVNVHGFSEASPVSGRYDRANDDVDGRAHWVRRKGEGQPGGGGGGGSNYGNDQFHVYHTTEVPAHGGASADLGAGGIGLWCISPMVRPLDGPTYSLASNAPVPPSGKEWVDRHGWPSRVDFVFDPATPLEPPASRAAEDPYLQWDASPARSAQEEEERTVSEAVDR
eukprot:g4610.t1